jgi:DNA-binding HxlR family transcriptional regulator
MAKRAEDLPANWDLTLAHRILGKDSDLDRNVLLTLIGRPQRFSELEPLLRGRGKNNLTQALARLESEGLVQARLNGRRDPPVQTYELTAFGILVIRNLIALEKAWQLPELLRRLEASAAATA